MRAPDEANRPSLDSARRGGWGSWFLQEWGLLLLAGALAVILWEITSTLVIRDHQIQDVRVELVVAEEDQGRIGAIFNTPETTATIHMTCSEREWRAVESKMTNDGDGERVLRLRVSPQVSGTSRALDKDRDAWLWPVDNAGEIQMRADVPPGMVYKIEGMHQVHIARPPITPDTESMRAEGYQLQITDAASLPPTSVQLDRVYQELLAPRAILLDDDGVLRMTPDPIDLTAMLRRDELPLGVPHTFTLSFNRWRAAGGDAVTAQYRSRLALEPVKATLTVLRVEPREIKRRLVIQLHDRYEFEIKQPQPPNIIINATNEHFFTGKLEGPPNLLDEIQGNPDDWVWSMWVVPPDGVWPKPKGMGVEKHEWVTVRAGLMWSPRRDEWRAKGVRFMQAEAERTFYIKIRLKAAKKP